MTLRQASCYWSSSLSEREKLSLTFPSSPLSSPESSLCFWERLPLLKGESTNKQISHYKSFSFYNNSFENELTLIGVAHSLWRIRREWRSVGVRWSLLAWRRWRVCQFLKHTSPFLGRTEAKNHSAWMCVGKWNMSRWVHNANSLVHCVLDFAYFLVVCQHRKLATIL